MEATNPTAWSTYWQWLKRNAALLSLVLAFLTIICTATGVWIEEAAQRERCRPRSAEERATLRAVIGTAAEEEANRFATARCAASDTDMVSDVIYETAQVLLLNMSPRLGTNIWITLGRIFAVLFVVGLGLQALGKLMADSLENLRLVTWSCRGGHHIVCGLGRVGWPIVRQLRAEGKRVLVLERSAENELIDDARKLGAIVLQGDATDEKNFELAHLRKADAVYLVTGSDEENIESAVDVRAVLEAPARPRPDFRCFVHIIDPALGDVLTESLKANANAFRVQTFNVTRNTARQLIVKELTKIRPTSEKEVALYILVGFGTMGQTLATHLAELAHFENFQRPRILILTDEPKRTAEAFRARWGQFGANPEHNFVEDWDKMNAFDPDADDWGCRKHRPDPAYQVENDEAIEYACNAIFALYPKSVTDRGFLNAMAKVVRDDDLNHPNAKVVKPAIIFCHEQDQESYSTAVNFHRQFEQAHGVLTFADGRRRLSMYVWLPKREPLKKLLQKQAVGAALPIRPFGSCVDELKLTDLRAPMEDRIGQVIRAGYHRTGPSPLVDLAAAEADWAKDTEMNLNSNRMAAIHFEVKLAYLGLELVRDESADSKTGGRIELLPPGDGREKIVAIARMEHNRWMAERLLAGVSYGERSDTPPRRLQLCTWDVLIIHPKLSKTEPAKDFEQIETVVANLPQLGYRLRKIGVG